MSTRQRVSLIFLIHGLGGSAWFSRIPQIQAALHLSPGVLGSTLLAAAVGSVLSMPLTGRLIDREGSARVALISTVLFCLATPLMALANSALTLAAALLLFGAAASSMDVAMNAQAVAVEDRLGRSLMASFHALYSLGAMGGALLGGWAAAHTVAPLIHFFASGIALAAMGAVVARKLVEDRQHAPPPSLFPIPKGVLALAAVAFCFFMTEGAMADWSAIYLRDNLAAGPGTAALAYAAFSVTMTGGRIFGDRIIDSLGRTRTLRFFSLLAAAGIAVAVTSRALPLSIAGFALVGAGCCVIVPVAFAGAARVPGLSKGVGMAAVTGAGYAGLLAGPPLVGFTAEIAGLRVALGLLAALCASVALWSGSISSDRA